MITIQQVKPSHSGFGEFDLGEAVEQAEFNSVEEFVDHSCANGYYRDEDCDEAASEADGAIHGQGSGKVVGLMDADGNIQLWCVYAD